MALGVKKCSIVLQNRDMFFCFFFQTEPEEEFSMVEELGSKNLVGSAMLGKNCQFSFVYCISLGKIAFRVIILALNGCEGTSKTSF